jgi:hypothetical protein
MLYTDCGEAMIGDDVAISGNYRGVVVASIDRAEYSAAYPEARWAYLKKGVLMETDFDGLAHYENSEHEHFTLISRTKKVSSN